MKKTKATKTGAPESGTPKTGLCAENTHTDAPERPGRAKPSSAAAKGPDIKHACEQAIERMEESYDAVTNLSDMRLSGKMSNSRVSGIARELRELIKVLRMYTI